MGRVIDTIEPKWGCCTKRLWLSWAVNEAKGMRLKKRFLMLMVGCLSFCHSGTIFSRLSEANRHLEDQKPCVVW